MTDIFNQENIPTSKWFSFGKIGDELSGQVIKIFNKEAQGQFPAQICFTLKNAEGIMSIKNKDTGIFTTNKLSEEEMNVGVKDNDFFRPRLSKVQPGDYVGFRFESEIPTKIKGNSPAKQIQPFVKKISEAEREEFMKTISDNNVFKEEFVAPEMPSQHF